MASRTPPPEPVPRPALAALVEEGLAEARAVEDAAERAELLSGWFYFLAAIPACRAAAEAFLPELADEPAARFLHDHHLLDCAAREGAVEELPRLASAAAVALRQLEGWQQQASALDYLRRTARTLLPLDRAAARELLLLALPVAERLPGEESEQALHRAVTQARFGETLADAGDPRGTLLLERAAAETERLEPDTDVLRAVAAALAAQDAPRARAVAARIPDPGERYRTLLGLLRRAPESERSALVVDTIAAARLEQPLRQPEAFVRLAVTLEDTDPAAARLLLEEAFCAVDEEDAYLRSVQRAGAAAALRRLDAARAQEVLKAALADAAEEPDDVRRLAATVIAARELSGLDPQAAQQLFAAAVEEAARLPSTLGMGFLASSMFPRGPAPSEQLDLAPARALLDALRERLDAEGVSLGGFDWEDVALAYRRFDPQRAADALERALERAVEEWETVEVPRIAEWLHDLDEARGRAALERVAALLEEKLDCPAMEEFCHRAAAAAPDLALRLAEQVPDSRGRAEALSAVAAALYPREPERALALLRALPTPAARSEALLQLVRRELLPPADEAG